MKSICIILVLIATSSCSLNPDDIHIFALPNRPEKAKRSPFKKITFALTNSFNGHLEAKKEYYERNQGVFVNVGGCIQLKQYTNALKSYYKNDLVLAHIGNFTSSKLENYHSITNCISQIKYDIIAPSAIEVTNIKKIQEKKLTENFLITNLIDLKTGKNISEPPFQSSMLLEKGDIKIGFISIYEPEVAKSEIGENFINGHIIEDSISTILKENHSLKSQGADIIVLLYQSLSECHGNIKTAKKLNHDQLSCRYSDSLKKLVRMMPEGTVDIILSSGTKMANGYISKIPVIQNKGNSEFISMAEIYYNESTKKVFSGRNTVLPPIKICHKYFKNTEDCYMKSTKKFTFSLNRNDLIGESPNFVSPKVLGITLEEN